MGLCGASFVPPRAPGLALRLVSPITAEFAGKKPVGRSISRLQLWFDPGSAMTPLGYIASPYFEISSFHRTSHTGRYDLIVQSYPRRDTSSMRSGQLRKV